MSSKQCPQCRFMVPAEASVCGYCRFNLAAHEHQQALWAQQQEAADAAAAVQAKADRLQLAEKLSLLTVPISLAVAGTVGWWIWTWEIGWGWKLLWSFLLVPISFTLVYEWLIPMVGGAVMVALSLLMFAGVFYGGFKLLASLF